MPKKRAKSKIPASLEKAAVGEGFTDVFPNHPSTIITIRKTANETVNNSAALQDDNDFYFYAQPNDIWDIDLFLIYSSATTADFTWSWSFPTGSSYSGIIHRLTTAAAANTDDLVAWIDDTGNAGGGLGVGTEVGMTARGLMVIGATGGLVKFQWAQASAVASNTVLHANSFMTRRKL